MSHSPAPSHDSGAKHRPSAGMPLLSALEVVAKLRREEIVVTTMGSAREWPKLSQHPLDFQYLPSAMGHAPALALGLALSQPRREVICFNGDGGMLMSLGALVTIVAAGAKNLTLIVIDNGLYEVTGGQATAGAVERERSGGGCDFAAMAQAAGFRTTRHFVDLDEWQGKAGETLALPGPRFIQLYVRPVGAEYHLPAPTPLPERIARFRAALEA